MLSEMVRNPAKTAILWIGLFIVIVAVVVLLTSGAESYRLMYCQSSAEHAIECTAKGWW